MQSNYWLQMEAKKYLLQLKENNFYFGFLSRRLNKHRTASEEREPSLICCSESMHEIFRLYQIVLTP